MKKIGLGLLGLALVLVAALLVAPSFVDWNAHKSRISKEVFDLTGRDLVIDGDVSLVLLPAPSLSVARVRLANIEGGSAPSMADLDALKVRIAFLPLLQGEVQVESVDLVRPRILAEVLPDGRKNWEFSTPEPGAAARLPDSDGPAADRQGEGIAAAISLDRVTITEGSLIYRDATTGFEEQIEALNAEVAAESLKGPFAASGQAKIRGVATDFELSLGSLVSGGATSLSLVLGMPKADASVQFAGALSLHNERVSLRGRLKGLGKNLAALVATLPLGTTLPAVFAKPFTAESEVAADRDGVTISKLAVQIADTKAEGQIQLTLEPSRDLQLRLSASRVDLDALLAPSDGGPPAAQDSAATPSSAPTPAPSSTQADPTPLALPPDITASLDVSIDAVVFRGQVVRQFLLSLALKDGRLKLSQALALLPGGSDASLTGTVAPAGETGQTGLRFDGRLEAGSDNLRGILDWVGVDVAEIPASRLRKMSLTTNIGATQSDIMLSDVDLRFDLSQITGGVAVALRERPGVGIGLALDKIDLDAYLPAERQADRSIGAAPESGASEAPTAAEARASGAQEAAATRPVFVAPAGLADFDANFDLRVGQMTLREITAANLYLDATLQQGSVALRELLIGDIAGGAKIRLAGTFAALTTAPVVDAAYDLSTPNPAGIAKALGMEPGPLAKAKSLDFSGTVKGGQDQLAVTSEVKALDGRFAAKGRVNPLAVPLEFDLDLSGKHGELAKLVTALVPDLDLDPSTGALDLSAKVAGTPEKISLSAVKGQLGPLTLDGGLTADLGGAEPAIGDIDMTVAAKHPDLAALIRPFAPDAGMAPGLGLDLKARVQGTQQAFRLSGIAGKIGPSELSGSGGLDLSGARPLLSADLVTGVLPLNAFTAPAAGGKKTKQAAKPSAGGSPSTGAAGPKASARWSREAIDTAALGGFDADLNLRAAALVQGRTRLDNAVVDASLKEGVVDLRKISGTIYDGAVLMTGKIDTRAGIETGLALTAIELNLAKLAKELADSDRVSGPLNLDASITAKGRSEAELVSSLAGNGDLSGTLNLTAKAEEQVGSIVLGILGQKVKEIRGVTDATNVLFSAFAGAPAKLTGTFTIDKGVVATSDLRVDGRKAAALTQGTADLAAWQIDTRTDVFREGDPDTPYLTAKLTGPLDKPNPKIAGQPFRRDAAPAPADTGAQPAPAPAEPTQPQQIKPEDILKKGLKGLLKGLSQ